MPRGIAPLSTKVRDIQHLGDRDTTEDLVFALTDLISFRTWEDQGLRSRSLRNYYRGFRFTEPGQLPEPFAELFRSHAQDNLYTVYLGETPVAWFHQNLRWVAPKLDTFEGTRFADAYERVHNAVLIITGKGPNL